MSLGGSLSPGSKIEILKIIIQYHLTVQMLKVSIFELQVLLRILDPQLWSEGSCPSVPVVSIYPFLPQHCSPPCVLYRGLYEPHQGTDLPEKLSSFFFFYWTRWQLHQFLNPAHCVATSAVIWVQRRRGETSCGEMGEARVDLPDFAGVGCSLTCSASRLSLLGLSVTEVSATLAWEAVGSSRAYSCCCSSS